MEFHDDKDLNNTILNGTAFKAEEIGRHSLNGTNFNGSVLGHHSPNFIGSEMGRNSSNRMEFDISMIGQNLINGPNLTAGFPGQSVPQGTNFTITQLTGGIFSCPTEPSTVLSKMAMETLQINFSNIEDILTSALQPSLSNNNSVEIRYDNGNITCIDGSRFNTTLYNLSIVLTVVFFVMILFGNSIILAVTSLDKSLRSPVFVILQSLSVISIFYSIDYIFDQFSPCEIFNYGVMLTGSSTIAWYIVGFHIMYSLLCENLILCHFVLLALLRIVNTVLPLQARLIRRRETKICIICIYILSLIIEILFLLFIYLEQNIERMNFDTPMVRYRMFLVGVVAILLVTSMLVSFIQARRSAASLQSSSQKRQSKVASIVITMFAVFYVPLVGIQIFLYYTCPSDTMLFVVFNWLPSKIQFSLYALNPIILCLRQQSMRKKTIELFRCFSKRKSGKT